MIMILKHLFVIRILMVILGVLLLGLGIVVWWQPRSVLRLITLFSPDVVYFVDTPQPKIALTIDDGIDPVTTPEILAILQNYHAHATFFLISSTILGNENIVSEMVNQGQEIGNHMTEDKPSICLNTDEFEQNIAKAHHILSQFAPMRWFRPAGGWYNSSMLTITQKYGYKTALGSVFPWDTHLPFVKFTIRHVLAHLRSGNIIVLHDGKDRGKRTVAVLRKILPEIQRRGYEVVTLSNLLNITY